MSDTETTDNQFRLFDAPGMSNATNPIQNVLHEVCSELIDPRKIAVFPEMQLSMVYQICIRDLDICVSFIQSQLPQYIHSLLALNTHMTGDPTKHDTFMLMSHTCI